MEIALISVTLISAVVITILIAFAKFQAKKIKELNGEVNSLTETVYKEQNSRRVWMAQEEATLLKRLLQLQEGVQALRDIPYAQCVDSDFPTFVGLLIPIWGRTHPEHNPNSAPAFLGWFFDKLQRPSSSGFNIIFVVINNSEAFAELERAIARWKAAANTAKR